MQTLTLDFRRRPKFLSRILPAGPGRWSYEDEEITANRARALIDGLHAALLVCGYNSTHDEALDSYRTVLRGLEGVGVRYDAAIFVLWPTGTKPGYHLAESRVYWDGLVSGWGCWEGMGNRLRDQLRALPYASLDMYAHSLGNGIVLDALRAGDVSGIRNLVMAAPAVEDDAVSYGGRFQRSVQSIAGRALVFSSLNDPVLQVAYGAAKLGRKRALGYSGPRGETPRQVVHVDGTAWAHGHSAHRDAPEYYAAIKAFA